MTRDNTDVSVVSTPDPSWRSLLTEFVATPDKLDWHAIDSRQWIAVPVAIDEEIAVEAAARMGTAVRRLGVSESIALLVEPPTGLPECLSFAASAEGFAAFQRVRLTFVRYLVTSRSVDFALLYSEEFYAVAGRPAFVAEALGCSPELALARFGAYAARWRTRNLKGYAYFGDITRHYRGVVPERD